MKTVGLQRFLTLALKRFPWCQFCGVNVIRGKRFDYLRQATVDHVVPRSKGGMNTWDNLAIACDSCNQLKADEIWKVCFGPLNWQDEMRRPFRMYKKEWINEVAGL